MTRSELAALKRAGVCYDGYRWARKLGASARDTWEACPRADWLYFAAWKLGALDPRQVRDMVLAFVDRFTRYGTDRETILGQPMGFVHNRSIVEQRELLGQIIRFMAMAAQNPSPLLTLLQGLWFRTEADEAVVELCYNTFRDFATSELACEVIREFVPFEVLTKPGNAKAEGGEG